MINSKETNIFGITLDREWSFHHHIKNICKKSRPKTKCFIDNSPIFLKVRKKESNIQYNDQIPIQLLSAIVCSALENGATW